MTYADVCSGISAPTVAWKPLGWECQFFSETELFPSRVLKYHYPDVPNLGDMLKLEENEIFQRSTFNVLVGGTPCQSFSLAGLRGGLADVRGNLALEFCRILAIKKPRWFVWENVPGVFSSWTDEANGLQVEGIGPYDGRNFVQTNDFATLLAAFRECGYSVAWRVLDSQFFGVPQRRRRVFVVGYFGNDWRPPFAVLFDPHRSHGDITKGKKEREGIAGTLDAGTSRSRGAGTNPGTLVAAEPLSSRPYADRGPDGNLIPTWWDGGQTAQTLDAVLHKGQTMPEKNRFPAVLVPADSIDCRNHSVNEEISGTLQAKENGGQSLNYINPVLLTMRSGDPKAGGSGPLLQIDKSAALRAASQQTLFHTMVRRLTPLECERLQGFPDHFTAIPKAADGPRYKALGNSMTVDVLAWIGRRMDVVDKIFNPENL